MQVVALIGVVVALSIVWAGTRQVRGSHSREIQNMEEIEELREMGTRMGYEGKELNVFIEKSEI